MKSNKLALSLVAASITLAAPAAAVGTRYFVLDSLSAFEGGDLSGVAISSDGSVRAGWTLSDLPLGDATSVWDSVTLDDGSVLLGTGSGGRIYRVKRGQTSIAASTGTMAVSALAVAFDGSVIAGTFPEGKLFKLSPASADGGELKPWVTLPDTENVWDLAYDPKSKALYAATGPEGRLYRIDASGKAQVYFDSDEPHLVSVATAADGSVYAGSSGKALLYHVTGPGRASVLHDFDGDDVRALAVVPPGSPHAGSVYAIANDYKGALKSLRPPKPLKAAPAPNETKAPKPGAGKLVRFGPSGVAEVMLEDDSTHYVSLAIDGAGLPYVGTGAEGRVYTVDDNHTRRLMADTDERQIAVLAVAGNTRFAVSSDPVVFHEITGSGGAASVWTSKVLDAGLRAHFGMLDFNGDGPLELQVRTGNTSKPDDTWSEWSAAQAQRGKVKVPPGRYAQMRARWSRDPGAVLREARLAFITDNARALITKLDIGSDASHTGGSSVPASGGPPGDPNPKLRVRWDVDNPDSDELRYRLFYRPVDSNRWIGLLDPGEVLTKREYTWDTSGLPEGRYRLRVDASDELSNPPGRATSHSRESSSFVIDNTPPVLSNLSFKGNRLTGVASDGIGPIQRIEVAVVGGKPFYPVLPADGVLDEATESFDVDLGAIVPEGPQLLVVRAYDSAGNRTSATVPRR